MYTQISLYGHLYVKKYIWTFAKQKPRVLTILVPGILDLSCIPIIAIVSDTSNMPRDERERGLHIYIYIQVIIEASVLCTAEVFLHWRFEPLQARVGALRSSDPAPQSSQGLDHYLDPTCRLIQYPSFFGYPILGLGIYNHKVGYPGKGVWYEPRGAVDARASHGPSGSMGPLVLWPLDLQSTQNHGP